MSYVITISRDHPPLVRAELEEMMAQLTDFVSFGDGCWRWAGAPSGLDLHLNLSDDSLWTDGSRGWTTAEALKRLRLIAKSLNARVFGEEREDLTENQVAIPATAASGGVFGFFIAIALLPLVLLFAIVRIPLLIWRLARLK